MRKPFLFHSSLPEDKSCLEPPLFFFFSPLVLFGDVELFSCSFSCMSSSAYFQLVFCENCSKCRFVFDVFVGGVELYIPLLHHLDLPRL